MNAVPSEEVIDDDENEAAKSQLTRYWTWLPHGRIICYWHEVEVCHNEDPIWHNEDPILTCISM